MDYAVNITLKCIKPCDMISGGKYTIWLNHMFMGFKCCMAMETYVEATISNYSKVGFGFESRNELMPLMHLGFCGSPSLELGSQWTCHSLGCLGF